MFVCCKTFNNLIPVKDDKGRITAYQCKTCGSKQIIGRLNYGKNGELEQEDNKEVDKKEEGCDKKSCSCKRGCSCDSQNEVINE